MYLTLLFNMADTREMDQLCTTSQVSNITRETKSSCISFDSFSKIKYKSVKTEKLRLFYRKALYTKIIIWVSNVNAETWFSNVNVKTWFSNVNVKTWFSNVNAETWFSNVNVKTWFSNVNAETWFSNVNVETWFSNVNVET